MKRDQNAGSRQIERAAHAWLMLNDIVLTLHILPALFAIVSAASAWIVVAQAGVEIAQMPWLTFCITMFLVGLVLFATWIGLERAARAVVYKA